LGVGCWVGVGVGVLPLRRALSPAARRLGRRHLLLLLLLLDLRLVVLVRLLKGDGEVVQDTWVRVRVRVGVGVRVRVRVRVGVGVGVGVGVEG
jgi:hypothetical protein